MRTFSLGWGGLAISTALPIRSQWEIKDPIEVFPGEAVFIRLTELGEGLLAGVGDPKAVTLES